MSVRPVRATARAVPTREGAGVHLHRVFGFGETELTDPFLLLDDFRNDDPALYARGFPWHPHRGIETISYVLAGTVAHADSLGNAGAIGAGDVQWMTAGSGILHQEMPQGDAAGRMHGFQLWANLPARLKMTTPRYQDVRAADIPEVTDDDGTAVRIVIGEFWGRTGPVDGIAAEPLLLDVRVPPGRRKVLAVDTRRTAFAYVFEGAGVFADAAPPKGVLVEREVDGQEVVVRDASGDRTLVVFGSGDEVVVQAGPDGVRFLLAAGAPLREPVAWQGPIVMNSRAELSTAFQELRSGTFLKEKAGFAGGPAPR